MPSIAVPEWMTEIASARYGIVDTPRIPLTVLADLRALFIKRYEGETFIRILPENELPQTKNVSHTNYCDIGFSIDPRAHRVIVLAALDNLVKGAAGQAIQNMNICFGRPESEGLL